MKNQEKKFFLTNYKRFFLVLGGFMALTALLSFFFFMILKATGGEEVSVPRIEGMNVLDAMDTLQENKLKPYLMVQASSEIPRFEVISQETPAGARVKEGREVLFTVSIGPTWLELPDFTGKQYREVKSVLSAAVETQKKIYLEKVNWVDSEKPLGIIVDQFPKKEKIMDVQTGLTLWVSNGKYRKIPNLIGRYVEEAIYYLKKDGIEYAVRFQPTEEHKEDGRVIKQSPEGGVPAAQYGAVVLTVGKWKKQTEDIITIRYEIPQELNRREVKMVYYDNRGKKILYEGRVYAGTPLIESVRVYGAPKCYLYLIENGQEKYYREMEL
jgi:serine/threonine-protein kinase